MKWSSFAILCLILFSCQPEERVGVLNDDELRDYVRQFNEGDRELYRQHVPNDSAATFLAGNIPLVDLPDEQLEKIYYFRWWTYRKHIKSTPDGFVITEFLPDVSWSGKHNTINCPAGHQVYEGRWLRDARFMEDYLHFWLTDAGDGVRSYSFWIADAMLAFQKAHRRDSFMDAHLDLLDENYQAWESERRDEPNRLFWQIDDRDGMEFSASGRILNGGERVGGMAAIRPTINSYMYADARAIATMAGLLDRPSIAKVYREKAETIKTKVQQRLWNDSLGFFTVMPREYGPETPPLDIRELIGYVPWYFNLPADRPEYAQAWSHALDTTGFYAPQGLTVCEQSHPYFEVSYEGHQCQWNGPSWPFATTQALKGFANLLSGYDHHVGLDKTDYYELLRQYAESHTITLENGEQRPWIDENLDPYTGKWIARTRLKNQAEASPEQAFRERGKDYNHSAYCDLIIADLIGLKPQLDGSLVLKPLVPDDWDWFCLDRVNYHGKPLTVLWDRDGSRYGKGAGFRIYFGNEEVYRAEEVEVARVLFD